MKNKLNILFVCTVPSQLSGIPNVICNIIKSLDREIYGKIGYVSINNPHEKIKCLCANYDIELYILKRSLLNVGSYIFNLAKVAKEYDVIHVHGNSATMVLEMIAAKLGGIKVRISHSHNTTCSMKIIDRLARPLFYRLCNVRMACGDEAGRWLFGKRDFLVINNGIDVNQYIFDSSKRKEMRMSLTLTNNKVIGLVGNFVEQKNHRFLINIFHSISEKDNSVKLLLVGDGPLLPIIKELTKEYGIEDKIIFCGSVKNPSDYMQCMDIVVMPSLFEGLPLTMIEEQANGLYIVASDAITKDANLTGNVKYLPLSLNYSIWAEEIIKILSRTKRNIKISEYSIKEIKEKQFDLSGMANKIQNCYKESVTKLSAIRF